jgi:chemotaxis signal transduction protein
VDNNRAGQYITFRIAGQDFAMSAARIRGLLPIHDMVSVDPPHPLACEWLTGVASVRGHDFPVIDLARKLDLAPGAQGRQPCVIVVEIAGTQLIAFVADRVSELVDFRDRDFRNGGVRSSGRMRRVLNPDTILTQEELHQLGRAVSTL